MHARILVLFIVFLVGGIGCASAAKCQQCLGNNVACFNETSFYMCYDGSNPDKSQIIACPENEVCTGLDIVCAPADQTTPVCGDTSSCGLCELGGFACISRSKFALCAGSEVSAVTGTCPTGYVCDASSATAEICVKECKAEITCDKPDA